MKNLQVTSHLIYSNSELANASFITHGPPTDSYNVTKRSNRYFVVCQSRIYSVCAATQTSSIWYDCDDFYPTPAPNIVGLTYNDNVEFLFVGFDNGDVLSLVKNEFVEVDCVANFEDGLLQLVWSPDQEYVVCLVNHDTCLLLTSTFDNTISKVSLKGETNPEHAPVTVGWGKKETQFHGSAGKQAAKAPAPSVDPDLVNDSGGVRITWRGDSKLFAVSYFHKGARTVKVFNNQGQLEYISEPIPGIEEQLCWRPSGNLIAFTQRLPDKRFVAFMEKNGLKHGEFELPDTIQCVKKLSWNADSSILCTFCIESNGAEVLHLWTIGNYHWYLKQTVYLPCSLVAHVWDEQKSELHLLLIDGTYIVTEYSEVINGSKYPTVHADKAFVAVIDGCKILLTSFAEVIIPPPMSQWILECSSYVNKIIFPPDDLDCPEICFAAILSNGHLVKCLKDVNDTSICDLGIIEGVPSGIQADQLIWSWGLNSTLVACRATPDKTEVFSFNLDQLQLEHKTNLDGTLITIDKLQESALVQFSDGKLVKLSLNEWSVELVDFCLPEPCAKVSWTPEGLFALSDRARLYFNDRQLLSQVTSFFVHPPYLIATTSSMTLYLKHLSENSAEEITHKRLERGSKIITATGNSLILQLPRGNLETIQPRALTILSAGRLLDDLKYDDAVGLMRRQRINMNLCVDHDFNRFVENVDKFVSQVDPQWITLFISELTDKDVTTEMYRLYYAQNARPTLPSNKVSQICTLIRSEMVSRNDSKFTLPILSSLVKDHQMGTAIELAKSETSLQHLIFLVDVDRLFDEAVGAYNLEAALKIAEKSQKDPKEYVPYLNSLRVMEPNYMKFTIDKSFKKYSSAIKHIVHCDEDKFNECLELIQQHSLYAEAVNIFKDQPERFKIIAVLFGDYLFKDKYFEEAGIMYERGDDKKSAIKSYAKSENWRRAIRLCCECNCGPEEIKGVAEIACSSLRLSKNYLELGNVYNEILKLPECAVEAFIKGRLWDHAIAVCDSSGQENLTDTVKNAVIDVKDSLKEEIESNINKINNFTTRLQVVRVEKAEKSSQVYNDDLSDSLSDTSSVSSLRTSRTSASKASRNTRKTQRRMWSLKEGNPREEQALLANLAQLIEATEKLSDDVRSVCLTLLRFNEDPSALALQNDLKHALKTIDTLKSQIWPKEEGEDEQTIVDKRLFIPPSSGVKQGWELRII